MINTDETDADSCDGKPYTWHGIVAFLIPLLFYLAKSFFNPAWNRILATMTLRQAGLAGFLIIIPSAILALMAFSTEKRTNQVLAIGALIVLAPIIIFSFWILVCSFLEGTRLIPFM
jgi:hypothetical protein